MANGLAIGRIVHYTISEYDAENINRRRDHAGDSRIAQRRSGAQVHYGNVAMEGNTYPAIVVKVWDRGVVNLQVFLDGNDILWATMVPMKVDSDPADKAGVWFFPPRV